MTIAQAIREAALYSDKPFFTMPDREFIECDWWAGPGTVMSLADGVWFRTFLLFVAEALETE